MKIAPTLDYLARHEWTYFGVEMHAAEEMKRCDQATKELRALLAVARAAKRLNGAMHSGDWNQHIGFGRAIARLEKVSAK